MMGIYLILVPLGLAAVSLLWQGFRAKRVSGLDGPAFLLDRAVRMLSHERRDWGRAMTAELARITEGRWQFALGCAFVAFARPVKPRLNEASAAVFAGVAACAAIGVYVLARYPLANHAVHNPLGDGRRVDLLIACGLLLATYPWLALKPPGALAESRTARRIGAGAGLLYGAGLLAATLTGQQLGAAITGLVMFPLWALLLGLIGAKSGKAITA